MSDNVPLLSRLQEQPTDGLLALMLECRADPRPDKLDLGIGVYRDDYGQTPVMAAVKEAERLLLGQQETKAYLGVDGDTAFVSMLAPLIFGATGAADPRLIGMQTPGGTGALRLAADLLAASGNDVVVWMGDPTWANHQPIFLAAGVRVQWHPFYQPATGVLDFVGMFAALETAAVGDAVLLHGCCHNPAGVDFTLPQWDALADVITRRRLLPIVDLAYQGLGRGFDEDAEGLRRLADKAEAVIVTYSCDKNFGLYRERTGALWVRVGDEALLPRVRTGMRNPARASWSMPPDHGAAVVRIILSSPDLTQTWRHELEAMRRRIFDIRTQLANAHPSLAGLHHQTGMFAMLPVSTKAARALRRDNAIYIVDDGRVNLAGLTAATIPVLMDALVQHLPSPANSSDHK
ncbi:aromatic amino acid transaminase [Sphingomonas sp. NFX23]|uniref:amino acid aminotransferase n=1 Tax=Sphingomonas sp. NFX23 TaxID=2819532 RepID=UPI003CF31F35